MSEQDLFGLMAVAEENTKAATLAVGNIANERAALADTITNLNTQITALKAAVENAAAKGVKDSITQAPKEAATTLSDATKALKKAAGDLKSSAHWLSWQLVVLVAIVCVAMVVTAYSLARYMTPSNAQIEAKRTEVAELETNIASLKKRGARIELSTCGEKSRLCARVDVKAGVFGESSDYVILQGY
jgi:cell division protein FtsL